MAGYEVAVVHGGPPRDAAKWLKATAYPFRFISDQYTAVMRAYGVFDRGHLAHPSIFIVDQSGTLRFRRVFDEPDVVPDLAHLMMMVKQNRK
jgi:peroxiredoxin